MTFTVYKLNHLGEEQLSYEGELLERGEHHVCIRAKFASSSRDLGYVSIQQGDIFTEWFYDDRWYNIFRLQDQTTGALKGFYCNLTRPAQISENSVKADDLALDVFIKPGGEWLLLDEDEYEALHLSAAEDSQVQAAIAHIKQMVQQHIPPFDVLP
ncbi:MAG: DUF402 domain-containing protein [Anaerolineae bacterium]|nr:DUF402 domain-containing protein [Anaerolineae bacterium]